MTAFRLNLLWLVLFCMPVSATSRFLDYPDPDANLSGQQIADQVYFVNHLYAYETVEMVGSRKLPLQVINVMQDKRPSRVTAKRYVNHRIDRENIKTRDMLILTTGKQKGVGILVTDYLEQGKAMGISLWLPVLRKVRRMLEPEHDEIWAGSILTYGDIYLRRTDEEQHELLDELTLQKCLESIDLPETDMKRWQLPAKDCTVKNRPVYLLKSQHVQPNWWYDYRLRWVDKNKFTDYRIEYYKDGKLIKWMTKSWHESKTQDPRGSLLRYWYARQQSNGQQSFAYVPVEAITINTNRKSSFCLC